MSSTAPGVLWRPRGASSRPARWRTRSRLLTSAETGILSALQRAHVDLLRAEIAFAATRGRDAPRLLVAAAHRFSTLDPIVARETYLEALSAAMFAGRLAGPGASVPDVAQAARAAPPPPNAPRPPDLLLDGLATLFSDGFEAGAPILHQAHLAFDAADMSPTEQLRWKWLATLTSMHLWDDLRWETISERHVQLARETGALGELPLALVMRAYVHLFAGELSAAASLVDEIRDGDGSGGRRGSAVRRRGTPRPPRSPG